MGCISMSPEPVVAERAYLLLKADIMAGRWAPGVILIERTIAAEYGVSVSPLRDAAQRLVGEHMLEIGPGGGYRLPEQTREALCDLYRWHSHLVRLIVKALRPTASLPLSAISRSSELSLPRATTELFLTLADACADREYGRALRSATERLHPARLGEVQVMDNLVEELRMVEIATISGRGHDHFEALWAYHRRRIRRVDKIFEAMSELPTRFTSVG